MTTPQTSKQVHWFCLVPALTGAIALMGWVLGDDRLKSVVPGLIAMNPLTAICFLTSAAALWLCANSPARRRPRLAASLGVAVALVGGVKLGSYLFGFDVPIDRWLFADALGDNRMAPEHGALLPDDRSGAGHD